METVITTLLVMGMQASILAVIIIAFRGIFKKIPKIYIYVLWLIMLLRLIVPVIIESDYGMTPTPERLVISATNEGAVPSTPAVDSNGNPAGVDTNNQSTTNATTSGNHQTDMNTSTESPSNEIVTTQPSGDNNSVTTPAVSLWKQAWFLPSLCILWAAGAVAVLLITAIHYLSMKHSLRFAIRISENIWECETVNSPFVMGFVKPRIYLPINLPKDEREYILLHEQMHIKHLDHITRLLMTLAIAIHWWNPIVWLAMNLMKKDMEMLCDESATKTDDPDYRKSYSMVLLKYAAKNSGLSPVLSFGESNTEGRVKHLMFMKKPKFYVNIIMVLVLCFCLIGCMANGVSTETEKPSYIPEETVTLTLYSDLSSYEGIQEGWFADVLLEKFNVKLDIKMSTTESDENPYIGDYDIIICGGDMDGNFSEAVQNGHILGLSNDIQTYMPYISEHLTESFVRYPEYSDDEIYAIYGSTSNPKDYEPSYLVWNLRFDYYEELGKPVISNIEDWVNVLEQMQEKHPTTEGGKPIYATNATYVDVESNGQMYEVSQLVQGYYGYDPIGMGFYDWNTNKYYDILALTENGDYGPYLSMLKVYNELYQRGLLYTDSTPNEGTIDEVEMLENGQYLTNVFYGGTEYMYPVIPTEAKRITRKLGTVARRCIAIDSETKYPELAMAIVDYFYSPEGMLTLTYGPEGECWSYDEDGYTCFTELGLSCYYDRFTTLSDGSSFDSGSPRFNFVPYTQMAINTDNGEPFNYIYWKNVIVDPLNEVEAAWREWTGTDSIEKYIYSLESSYLVPLTDVYYEPLDTNYETLSRFITDKCWEAIMASTDEEFDVIVQSMITQAKSSGYEECVEYGISYIKEAYNRQPQ